MIRHLPNIFTLINLFCGFLATIFAIEGYIDRASFCIIAGMLFDFSDGMAARLFRAYSDTGRELDNLADVVTFGIAPGAIVYTIMTGAGLPLPAAVAVAALLPLASALRLARFITDPSQVSSFRGLATPASAFTLVSVVLPPMLTGHEGAGMLARSPWFIGTLTLFLAVMMLVNLRMISLKFTHFRYVGNEERYLFLGASVMLLIFFRLTALPMIMGAYIVISLLFSPARREKSS